MVKKLVQQSQGAKASDVPKVSTRGRGRPGKSRETADPVVEKNKDDEIIGVKVHNAAEFQDPMQLNKSLPPMEEAKAEPEGPSIAELQKKKSAASKKAATAEGEGAFNLYIYRVMKEQCHPDAGLSKKAMRTLNSIAAEKFGEIMKEARNLVINTKKQTLSSKEIETAVKLTIFGELGQNAVSEGRHALRSHHAEANK